MIKIREVIFTCLLFFLGLTNNLSAATPIAELKALLAEVNTLQAQFEQKMMNSKGGVLQKSAGQVWLKKPGKFRWQIEGKDQRVVVADGKQIWDYDIDLEQVTVQQLGDGQGAAPIFFLSGETEALPRDFTVTSLAKTKNSDLAESDVCFELKPKQQQGAFQWIRIGFKNKALKELELLDQLGQRSYIQFDHVVLNSDIDAIQFQFTPPKGVDVVGR